MIHLQDVYAKSPVLIQNLAVSLSGAMKARNRYGKVYRDHRKWLNDYDTWSLERMLEDQAKQLREFIRFAATHSPYYRHLYRDADPENVSGPADLASLPILEKEALRSSMTDLYTVPKRRATEGHTGGTTGKSLVVRYTLADGMRRMAMLDHFKSRHGFENRRMRKATFSGKHIVPSGHSKQLWRYNAAANQMLYSTFHISEANLPRYVDHLNEYRPLALEGFFTSLCDIANHIERHGAQLRFRPIGIFPTSETVTPRGRSLLERVFKTKVYDQYASSEGAPFITECSAGSLHVELSTGVFENLPGTDEILVTSFSTHGTPLIRYRIGDSMVFAPPEKRCSCGYPTPLVDSIHGRSDDFLLRADGAKINGGHVANLFKNMPNALIQAQAEQTEVGHVRILLVVDSNSYSPRYDDLLRDEFRLAFGEATSLTIEHVSEIPRAASGKQRLIRNLVAEGIQADE